MADPGVTRVSGNLVIICLTVVTTLMVASLAVLMVLQRPIETWAAVFAPALVMSIGYIAQVLKTGDISARVEQVRTNTNGNTERLMTLIERQTELLSRSQPPPDPPPQADGG